MAKNNGTARAIEKSSSEIVLDDLDKRIIDALKIDGRMPVTDIAARVDSTSSTVRKRLQRLEETNSMRVVAVTDFYAAGYDVLLAIGVEVENRSAEEVGMALAELDHVFSVNLTTGQYDLEILVAAKDHEELCHIVHEEFSKIEGIVNLDTAFALDVLKYQTDVVISLEGVIR